MLVLFVVCVSVACTSADLMPASDREAVVAVAAETININTASLEELTRIPFIGEKLAVDIVAHREKYGPFRRPEHLLLLDGISDRRFREIKHLIRTD